MFPMKAPLPSLLNDKAHCKVHVFSQAFEAVGKGLRAGKAYFYQLVCCECAYVGLGRNMLLGLYHAHSS